MSHFAQLAATRRSIRKFEDRDIPFEDIEECIRIAVTAPSGCNSQCWKFVAVKDREVIGRLADVIAAKVEEIMEGKKEAAGENYFISKRKAVTFFTKAPVVVAVFMTGLQYYDPIFAEALMERTKSYDAMMQVLGYADVLSVGAAIQNFLLAVHEKGYGACWMNDPAIAGEEIREVLGIPEGHKFISLIPVGVPAYTPREKKMKDFGEVFQAI